MLSEANRLAADADATEEQESASHEVADGLVTNKATADSLANRHLGNCTIASILLSSTPQGKLSRGDIDELGMALVLGIDKVLDLSHGELTDTKETLAGRDLVTEAEANLGSCEGQTTIVELDEAAEVDEHTLGGLGAKIALLVTGWANLCIEHKIEGHGWGERVRSVGVLNIHSCDDGINLLSREVFNISLELKELLALIWFLALLKLLGDELLDELISAAGRARLHVLDHQVLKFLDVTRGLKDLAQHKVCAADLEHVLLKHEVLPPKQFNVVLDRAAKGTVVEESGDTAIDLEAWCHEELALHEVLNVASLVFLGQVLGGDLLEFLFHH